MSELPPNGHQASRTASREHINPDMERTLKSLLDALLDDPSSIRVDPSLLQDTNPNPEASKPYIDPTDGETYKECYSNHNGVYLKVQRTVRHDENQFDNPLVTTHHLMVQPDLTSRSEIWLTDGQVTYAASLDYINPTGDMRETSPKTAEDALAALQLTLDELRAD